ncbi:terpenoid synthase [Hypoxylon trugodes]|uniref:terpenoid synthase n=1 Tax=Hypoxylon trugodes TaxID=326681 RepID=UPI0021A09D4A|nr:terpenoid synthase [Hypoxylon trugodes]KAI1393610.1 terpenoid synthase [Hypoxylon trugodes]
MTSKKMTTLIRLARRTRTKFLSLLFPCPFPWTQNDLQYIPDDSSSQQGLCGEALVLASQLDSKTFRLPNLWEVFSEWPLKENPHVKRLEGLVNSMLERIVTNERKLKALKQANFARLISLWYPDAEWPELEIATAYSVWIFVWDDEVDAGDTDVSHDEELSRAYYQKSLDTIHHLLGLDTQGQKFVDEKQALHPNMVLFTDAARGIRSAADRIQRERFYHELEHFMIQVGVEHSHRMRGSIPTVEKYLEIRSGSVGCAPQIAITDLMLKVRLPESIMESAPMKGLWKETVIICLILNDIYSAQKEIAQASLLNLVPVMFKNCNPEKQSLDLVTHGIEETLRTTMRRFEEAATALSGMASHDVQLDKDVQAFIKWCRYFITGVLQWSLESKRYGMAECLHDDGSLSIVL